MNRTAHSISPLSQTLALMLLCWCSLIHAQVPRTLNYQGYLTSPSGAAINNASQAVTIKIYDAPTAGNLLYTEPQSVTVSNGIFNLLIGSGIALPLPFDKQYWLGITVGADPEMSPRQPLAASPYAIRSASSESLATTAVILPGNLPAAQRLPTVACATNQIPQWNGSAWICATPSAGGGTGMVTSVTATAPLASSGGATPNLSLGQIALAGDVTGTQGATVVGTVSGTSAASVASGATLANAATSVNTAGMIVRRDANGNFAGGTVTGNFAGSLTGNATTATKLATARSINAVAFDGTADIVLPIYGAIIGTFNQPAVGANTVPLVVSSSAWMTLGQVVYVATGGYYTVFSTPDTTHVVLTNLGYAVNTAPASTGNGGAVSPAGPAGANGFKSLVAMATEPAGSNCAYGGTKVSSGVDLNSNGVLDPGEVTTTGYACNGTPYAVVPSVPPGCTTRPLSLSNLGYVSPAGLGGVVYRGDTVTFSVVVNGPPNTCSSVTVSNNYIWTLVSKPLGSTATLSTTSADSPALVADVAGGSYQLSVQVIDTLGNKSPTALVNMNVSACGAQTPTVSVDRPTVSQANFAPVTITATASSPDSQNNFNSGGANYCPARFAKTLSYQWQVTSTPVGGNFSLGGATTSVATFAPAAKGAYSLRLVVTDSVGLSPPSVNVPVTVLCGDQPPAVSDVGAVPAWSALQNMANIMQKRAGGTTTGALTITSTSLVAAPMPFYQGTAVKLGANVTDANYSCGFTPTNTTYQWAFTSVPSGSRVSFDSSSSATPSFVPDAPGDYYVQLTLTDSAGQSSTQLFTPKNGGASVKVSACGKQTPVSLIGLQSPASPAPTVSIAATDGYGVILDGSSSFSPDNAPVDFTLATVAGCGLSKPLSYGWSFLSTPPGAAGISLNQPTRVNPSFFPTVGGTYVVGLQVNDGTTSSPLSTVSIITADQASGGLDFVAAPGNNLLPGGTRHYNSFRVPVGATVLLDPNGATQYLDLRVTGDVFVGGSINVSGSAGGDGPISDVPWQGAGGGQTGYPFKQGITPNPGGGCSSTFGGPNVAIPQALGGMGSAGGQGASGSSGATCGGGLGGANGGGMGGGPGAGGGGGFGGGGGGGGNSCNSAGNSIGGGGGGAFAGAGGGAAQGGGGGNGGGAPYNGTAGTSVILGNCAGSGYGAGGGGGSIGMTAVQDLSMQSTFQTGSSGGGGAGDIGRGGGGGGGAIRIIGGGAIVVSGSILANGGRGGDSAGAPNCCQGGSGGGGSGGAIWLSAPTVYLSGTVSASGGRGGISQSSHGGSDGQGGPGGLGRIRLASPSITSYGIAAPALPAKLDGTANVAGVSWIGTVADPLNLP